MNKTNIEYLDFSWNPIAMRCTPVSPGCANCWHIRMANRLSGNELIDEGVRAAYRGDAPPVLVPHRLDEPLRRKKPARIGVQFMGDLFHGDVPLDFALKVYNVAEDAPQHIYQWLTKRPDKLLEFHKRYIGGDWLNNIWLGVSISTQAELWKVAELLLTPAAVRFVSVEPMLEAIDMRDYLGTGTLLSQHYLDQVICGAETGPGKRPMQLDWARSLRDQCQAANTSFFFKKDSSSNQELDGRLWEEFPR